MGAPGSHRDVEASSGPQNHSLSFCGEYSEELQKSQAVPQQPELLESSKPRSGGTAGFLPGVPSYGRLLWTLFPQHCMHTSHVQTWSKAFHDQGDTQVTRDRTPSMSKPHSNKGLAVRDVRLWDEPAGRGQVTPTSPVVFTQKSTPVACCTARRNI